VKIAEATVGMVELPALVTVADVDVVAAGTWQLSTGEATFTPEDLSAAVEAAQCPAVGSPVIKLGHIDPRFDGQPAIGRVRNMALAAEGSKIKGDLAGMPGWLGAVLDSAYPNRSIEGAWDYTCQIGHQHPFVITGLALLGVSAPGVGVLSELKDVAALYGLVAAGRADVMVAAGVSAEDVRRAYYDEPGTPLSQWVTEIELDPMQLIVCDEATSKLYRVPVTVKSGAVSFGDPVEVEIEYADVAASVRVRKALGSQLAWATADESRSVVKPKPDPEKQRPDLKAGTPAERYARLQAYSRAGQQLAAAASDADDDPTELLASLDAILDQASVLAELAPDDDASLPPDVAQALDLLTGAEAIVDQLMDLMGVYDPDDQDAAAGRELKIDAAGKHGAYTGTHSHQHGAYGSQGGDTTHEHSHTHSGDGVHSHAHAGAGRNKGKGGSDVAYTDEQKAQLRKHLGLSDDAELTDESILAGITKLADSKTEASGPQVKLPDGVVMIDRDEWDAQKQRIAKMEKVEAGRRVKERDEVIADAIRAGKFNAASRDRWARVWDNDPEGTRAVIAGLAKNVVPVADVGAAGADDEDIDEEYRRLFPPSSRREPAES